MKTLDYEAVEINQYANNLVDLMLGQSVQFSKNHEYTTSDGHLLGVLADITVKMTTPPSSGVGEVQLLAMPNTWKLRNAIRKFHFLRNHMFREAGIRKSELGTYGKTIRPYLDGRHSGAYLEDSGIPGVDVSTNEMMPVFQSFRVSGDVGSETFEGVVNTTEYQDGVTGYWLRSSFGTVPGYVVPDSGGGPETALAPADSWNLILAGPNVLEEDSAGGAGTAASFKSVGAIHAYNMDRQSVQVQEDDTSVDATKNPLAALAADGNQASGEILEIAERQQENVPPYDLTDDGDSTNLTVLDGWSFPTTEGSHTFRNVFVPAGMFRLLGIAGGAQYEVSVEVLGTFECREFA
tara:strand:- start:220 stop:1269 length:1050 start_codon:yes stop_codon:yes gene_type:complete